MLRSIFGPRVWKYADIRRFSDPYHHPHTIAEIADAYQAIFGDEPWNEGQKCPKCGTLFNRKNPQTLCNSASCTPLRVLLVERWPRSTVIENIYHEVSEEGGKCLLAYRRKKLAGFAWGYPRAVTSKLSDELEAPGLHEHISGRLFYVDEVAVLPAYRGRKIAQHLYRKLIENEGNLFLRTHKDSPMRHIAEKEGARVIQNISRDRVIMTT